MPGSHRRAKKPDYWLASKTHKLGLDARAFPRDRESSGWRHQRVHKKPEEPVRQACLEVARHPGFIREQLDADGSIHQVWQDSFKALPLWSSWMIWQKINYIHANPVKAGLVKTTQDYPWSSFRAFYQKSNEPLPVDQDWWWPDDSKRLAVAMKKLGWM